MKPVIGRKDDMASTAGQLILVVDDDQDIRDALAELLESDGYRVVSAATGKDALAYVEKGLRPRVIILDVMMPVMDGWDFRAAQMHHSGIRDTPVIVITAAGFTAETIRKQFGAVEFVPKPPPTDDLLLAVKRACDAATPKRQSGAVDD